MQIKGPGYKVAGFARENASSHYNFGVVMDRKFFLGALAAAALAPAAFAGKRATADGKLDSLISRYAAAYNVPESLVRRVIKRESGGNPRVVSRGNYGLMQIKLPTALSLGYRGSAAGLLDAETNMTYAVKYLAGAYRVANGNSDLAVHYYAAGYYYAAKRKGMLPTAAETSVPLVKTGYHARVAEADRVDFAQASAQ
jgi:soluble lytic murein transglycosylase-like protein